MIAAFRAFTEKGSSEEPMLTADGSKAEGSLSPSGKDAAPTRRKAQVKSEPCAWPRDLGDRLSALSLGLHGAKDRMQRRRVKINLIILVAALGVWMVVAALAAYGIVTILGSKFHCGRLKYPSEEDEKKLADTVQFVQDWYANLDSVEPLLPLTKQPVTFQSGGQVRVTTEIEEESACLHDCFSGLVDSVPFTTPKDAASVLESMGLLDVPDIVQYFRPLLLEGSQTSTKEYLMRSSRCLAESESISELLCAALRRHPGGCVANQHGTRKLVAQAIVLNVLTEMLVDNITLLPIVIDRMDGQQRALYPTWTGDAPVRQEPSEECDGRVLIPASHLQHTASDRTISYSGADSLQINILEAVKIDIVNGFYDNARVGIALAATLTSWNVAHGWEETFIAWEMAFVSGLAESAGIPFPMLAVKLLVPSISCEKTSLNVKTLMERRRISLAVFMTGLNDMPTRPRSNTADPAVDRSLLELLGRRSADALKISSPSKETVDEMFADLCGQGKVCSSSPRESEATFTQDEKQCRVFSGVVLCVTMMLTGFGLECFAFCAFLFGTSSWSTNTEIKWRLARLLFSLLWLVSFGLAFIQNALGAVTAVLCLWKFGFPECVTYVYMGLFGDKESKLRRASEIFNGVGLAIHQGAASLIIALLIAGVVSPGRHVSDPVSFLVMQHWFVLVRHVSFPAYYMMQLVLEIFFEWSMVSSLERIQLDHWLAATGAVAMVLAHWLFGAAAVLEWVTMSARKEAR